MTPDLLRAATGCTADAAARFAEPLSAACAFYGIDTPGRLVDFLSQIGHESGSLRYTSELWGPTSQQRRYERDVNAPWPADSRQAKLPEFAINRLAFSLGNTEPGDGELFKGHGLMQKTGRFNHARVRDRLRERFPHLDVPDFEAEPERLAEPQWAAFSAADDWDERGLNALSDAGRFLAIGRAINRGNAEAKLPANGEADRLARRARAKRALITPETGTTPAQPVLLITPETVHKEPSMPAPLVPLIAGLATSLINAFAPLAREKITKEMARHTDDSAVAQQIAGNVIEAAKAVTGMADPIEAVVAVRADPELVEQVQKSALDDLERMAPVLDKMAQWENEAFASSEASRDAAAGRNKSEWDMTPWLVGGLFVVVVILLGIMAAVIGVQLYKDGKVATEVWAQFAGFVGAVLGIVGTVYAFRFGTSRSSGAKDVVISQLARKP